MPLHTPYFRLGPVDACIICEETANLQLCEDCKVAFCCSSSHLAKHKKYHLFLCEQIQVNRGLVDAAGRGFLDANGEIMEDIEDLDLATVYRNENMLYLDARTYLVAMLVRFPTRRSIPEALKDLVELGPLLIQVDDNLLRIISYYLRLNELDTFFNLLRRYPRYESAHLNRDNPQITQWLRDTETADIFEDVDFLLGPQFNRDLALMATLMKIRLVRELQVLHAAVQSVGTRVPAEIADQVLDYTVSIPTVAKYNNILYDTDHSERIQKLRDHIQALFTAVHERNTDVWPFVIDAVEKGTEDSCLDHPERLLARGAFAHCNLFHVLHAWQDTPEAVGYIKELLHADKK